jgi:hypothetical protein
VTSALVELLAGQRSRPLSVAVAALSLFVPGSLLLFLTKLELYATMGVNGVILLSLAISLPILLLRYSVWFAFLKGAVDVQRHASGEIAPERDDILECLKADDPYEWPCFLMSGWSANGVVSLLAAVAYFKPLRLGATLLLTGARRSPSAVRAAG